MPRSNATKNAEFSPSARGLVLIAAAGALLALGIARDALAFLFWGAAFLLLAALGLLGILFEGLRARLALRSGKSISASLSLGGGAEGLRTWPGEPLSLRAGGDSPRCILPWMESRVMRSWRREAWMEMGARGRDEAFTAAQGISAKAPRRGDWKSDAAQLCISDAAGFFRLRFHAGSADRFSVWPRPISPPEPARGGSGGTEARREESFRRSDELLDSRPYLPGDDARRINWKQYGHSEELFIRQGEPEPPPRSLCLAAIDPSAPKGLGAAGCAELLDRQTALCAAWAQESARQGVEIILSTMRGTPVSLPAGGSHPAALLDRLAALPPASTLGAEARSQAIRTLLSSAPGAVRSVEIFCAPDPLIVDSWAQAASDLSCRLSFSLCGPASRLDEDRLAAKAVTKGHGMALRFIADLFLSPQEEKKSGINILSERRLKLRGRELAASINAGGSHAARVL